MELRAGSIVLHRPRGSDAAALLENGMGRVELISDPDKLPQAVAEKAGLRREGVLRGHTLHRAGRRRDAVIFSLLGSDL